MTIRQATIKDLSTLVGIYNQAIVAKEKTADLDTFSINQRLNWFKSHMNEKYPLFIIENNLQVAGYLTLSPYRIGRKALDSVAEISYYIDQDYQGKGLGSKLLEKAIEFSPKVGIENLIAIVIASNTISVKLLEKFKFQEWGRMPEIVTIDEKKIDHLYFGLKI